MLAHLGTRNIETERLLLRKFEYSDNESMRKYWISDEKIQSLYSEPVYSTEAARAVVSYGFEKINLH